MSLLLAKQLLQPLRGAGFSSKYISTQYTPALLGTSNISSTPSSFFIGIGLYSSEEIGYLHMMLNSKVHLSMAVAVGVHSHGGWSSTIGDKAFLMP